MSGKPGPFTSAISRALSLFIPLVLWFHGEKRATSFVPVSFWPMLCVEGENWYRHMFLDSGASLRWGSRFGCLSCCGDFFSGCIVQVVSKSHADSDDIPCENPQKSITVRTKGRNTRFCDGFLWFLLGNGIRIRTTFRNSLYIVTMHPLKKSPIVVSDLHTWVGESRAKISWFLAVKGCQLKKWIGRILRKIHPTTSGRDVWRNVLLILFKRRSCTAQRTCSWASICMTKLISK